MWMTDRAGLADVQVNDIKLIMIIKTFDRKDISCWAVDLFCKKPNWTGQKYHNS